MSTELKHIKITADTHKQLRLLAALTGNTMMEVLADLVSEALQKVQASGNSQGVQVSDLSNRRAGE